jgi:hypothetical protein
MRYVRLVALVVLLYPVTSAFATCPIRNELFTTSFFSFTTSCGSRSGFVSTGNLTSCTSDGGADIFNVGSGSVSYSMTVPSDLSGSPWVVHIVVDFNDPSTNSSNILSASVTVVHNGNVSHSETFFNHAGDGDPMSCQNVVSSSFSAVPGDTITVSYSGTNNNSGTNMRIAAPFISFN